MKKSLLTVEKLSFTFALFCALCVGILAISSLIITGRFPPSYVEVVEYRYTYAPYCLLSLTAILLVMVVFQKRAWKLPSTRALMHFMLVFCGCCGILWLSVMRTFPVADSAVVKIAAEELCRGEFGFFGPINYMEQHPYQIGLCLFEVVFFSIFGFANTFAFQVFNLGCALITLWLLCKLAFLFSENETVCKCCILFCFFSFPLLMNTTVVYGNILSYPLNVAAIYFLLRATKHSTHKDYALCAICIAFAKILKPTSLIFLIAILLFLCVRAATEKDWHFAVIALLLYIFCTLTNEAILLLGETITGGNLHAGQPMISWLAMGLQSGPLGFGWYNEYVDKQYVLYQGNASAITTDALLTIKNELINFVYSPIYTLRFFSFKIFSQWCEPSFGAFWNSVTGDDTYFPLIHNSLLAGAWHNILVYFLDIMQFLVYSFASLGLWAWRKRWRIAQLIPVLTVAGGFAYSIILEAKSFYVLPYYLLLFPYAAVGLYYLYCRILSKKTPSVTNKETADII